MKSFLLVFILTSCFLAAECINCDKSRESKSSDAKLKNYLLCNGYDKDIRPGKTSDATIVSFRYTLKSYSFEESDRILTVTAWMTMKWRDERLSWSEPEHNNIKSVHISKERIWIPDIYLYNSHLSSGDPSGTCHSVDCYVSSDGSVSCVMPCEHIGHCKTGNYVNWPFDRQNCSFTFGSWMKTGEEFNYDTDKIKVISKRAVDNNQWKLLSASVVYNIGKYSIAPNETYPSLTFAFYIERHSGFHVTGVIVPALILLICNLTVLWVLPGSTERFVLSIVNLFSHFLYLEYLYWELPHCGDSVPNVLIFFRDSQVISAVLLIQTLIIKTLTRKTDQKPYLWIHSIVTSATTYGIGEILLTQAAAKIEDPADLVESVKKNLSDESIWLTFCKLIDRVLFLIIFILYGFMFITLLPEGYLATAFNPIEVEE